MTTVQIIDCADETTLIGRYAKIASSANLRSNPGYFSKVGDGAKVGRNSALGSWSSVGHFAHVGDNVEFGQWAGVGVCAVVDRGSKLGSHEYVPSGKRRLRSGKTIDLDGFAHEDRAMFSLYDSFMGDNGPSVLTTDQATIRREFKRERAEMFAEGLAAFLERRKMHRKERPSIFHRWLALTGPAPHQ